MVTWDAKEREQFKIDAENLKNDIDAIQSEKIKLVQDEIGKVEAEFLNFKYEMLKKHSEDLGFRALVQNRLFEIQGQIISIGEEIEKEKAFNKKIFISFGILFLITTITLGIL